ncbi:MAG: ABC transporter substrate-binding protein [Clostridia bacterium]|nr:ABC transporter substrate-binding protein [Clostridia bacterium]
MKLSTKILSLILAVVMVLCAFSLTACNNEEENESEKTIKIGLTGPLTGGAAIYGIAVKNAAKMAVDEINAMEDNGLNGYKLELMMSDDKHDATQVETLYADLYEKGMQVSLGTVTTAPGLEFKTFAKDDNVFFITPSATGDAIPEYDNGYQMCFADSNQGTVAAEFFNENYADKKVGVFYKNDDEYSKGIYDNFMKTFKNADDVVSTTFQGEENTFDQQINTLKDCEIVFMPIYYTPASQFMKQANNTSIQVYYGCDGFDGIDALEGFDISTVKQEVSYLSHFNSNATEGPAADFIKAYNDKYDETKEPLNQFGAAAYDCVYAIWEAMKVAIANGNEITDETSASDLCEMLKTVFNSEDFVFHGITGKCEGDKKSNISWAEDGTVEKEAIKYIVKEKTN